MRDVVFWIVLTALWLFGVWVLLQALRALIRNGREGSK